MKILIADSGGTTTDWRWILDKNQIFQAKTMGINPYAFQEQHFLPEQIAQKLEPKLIEQLGKIQPEEIYFYAAGASTEKNNLFLREILQNIFPQSKITIQHDLLAAAHSSCGHQAGIVCIAGTGSNACLYNGENIINQVPSLGVWLGDEGGGTDLGKEIVKAYMHQELPEKLQKLFEKRFELTVEELLENVFHKSRPAHYIAKFSKFVFDYLTEPFCYELAYNRFSLFFDRYICKLENYQNYPLHFIGSVAFYYANIWRQVAQDKALQISSITESPIAGLTLYHLKEI